MVSKLGIILPALTHSQLSYELISSLNEFKNVNNKVDIVLFTENVQPSPLRVNGATLGIYDAWGYDGTLVATNLSTAKALSRMPGHNRKLFYVYNFEWIHNPTLFYEYIETISRLEIINRTESHAKLFENNFNKASVFNLKTMNVGELWTKLNTKNS